VPVENAEAMLAAFSRFTYAGADRSAAH
jgi:hypothetical protein